MTSARLAGQQANLADMSIEELMNESVTSVSKKETRIGESPAAIAVVTQDDIRRLGVTSLAEALRYVPGLDVARINANQWAVSARGFNFQYANKLLVLMDGRSVYTPMFGGVFWDTTDTVMEDIERIEVVRGPGATLWGANAVNGVINIITKSARDTQGLLVSTTTGTEDRLSATLRYGGQAGNDLFYRAYVKTYDRRGLVDVSGRDTHDDWRAFQTGFRMDWETPAHDAVTLQGDYYAGRTQENLTEVILTQPFSQDELLVNKNHGLNLLGRWTRTLSPDSQLTVQSYYDHSFHSGGKTNQSRDTFDLDLQHRFNWRTRHDFVWGLGYRYSTDDISQSPIVIWTPASRNVNLFTTFVQDQITLVPDRWSVILGSKFEKYDFTGLKTQPGVRLLWTPSESQTLWASASRAFKIPARYDTDARLNLSAFQPSEFGPVIELALLGNPQVQTEEIRAFELGYRIQPTKELSFDFAAFYNVYHNLIDYTAGESVFEPLPAPGHVLLPLNGGNGQSGHTHGAEVSVQWRPSEQWRLSLDYSWLQARLRPSPDVEGDSPQHQVHLRSYLSLSSRWELNTAVSYVGSLVNSVTFTPVPAYVRLDLGLVWRPTKSVELGVWGQNLLDSQHLEFSNINSNVRTEIPRSFTARFTWRY